MIRVTGFLLITIMGHTDQGHTDIDQFGSPCTCFFVVVVAVFGHRWENVKLLLLIQWPSHILTAASFTSII